MRVSDEGVWPHKESVMRRSPSHSTPEGVLHGRRHTQFLHRPIHVATSLAASRRRRFLRRWYERRRRLKIVLDGCRKLRSCSSAVASLNLLSTVLSSSSRTRSSEEDRAAAACGGAVLSSSSSPRRRAVAPVAGAHLMWDCTRPSESRLYTSSLQRQRTRHRGEAMWLVLWLV